MHTNKKSLLGPLFRHPRLQERIAQTNLLHMPYRSYHVWNWLFEPTPLLRERVADTQAYLGERYIGLHWRFGDQEAFGGGAVEWVDRRSNDYDVIRLLQCAHQIEEDLGYPNSTKWYLAADDFKVRLLAPLFWTGCPSDRETR